VSVFKFTEEPKRYILILGDEFEVEFAAKTSLVAMFCVHGIAEGFGFDAEDTKLLDQERNEVVLT
jgi:hypothetical protein